MYVKIYFLCGALIFMLSVHKGNATKAVFQEVSKEITDNIFIYLIQGPSYENNVKLKLRDGLDFANFTFFNKNRETVFYFHGWAGSGHDDSALGITNAFLVNHNVNIALFDYSKLVQYYNDMAYVGSFVNATYIGEAIGQYFKQYIPKVQQLKRIHCISHSLGSQIMSKAARTYGKGKLPWLTGLDPAGPSFNVPGVEHLTASDGAFVDVIHTDAGAYGDSRSIGTIDFFPNRGVRYQPPCNPTTTDYCSHSLSWVYYAESIRSLISFPAKKCERTQMCDMNLAYCSCKNVYTYMGYNVLRNGSRTGNFYLTTNMNSPYGQGMTGINFIK